MRTEDKITSIIAGQLYLDEDKLTPDLDIAHDLGADSVDLVKIFVDLEEQFSIDITDDESSNSKTIQQVIDLVKWKI